MAAVTVLKLVEVDARKIVNDSHIRIVTEQDVTLMENSFLENGYIPTANAITVRVATIPEILKFYQQDPHRYSLENAKKLTEIISRKPDFDGRVYAYDGLIRKAALLRMWKNETLPTSPRLRAMLVPQFSPRQAIAYGLAQNSVNCIAIKLSPLEILVACRKYDIAYNEGKPTLANQTDVAKCMVAESVPPNTSEETKSKQSETRRQVIGVCRKLPEGAFVFLTSILQSDVVSARNAYTTANLKAIPKSMEDEAVLCLLKRCQKGYYDHMPKPKSFVAQEVKRQAALTLEAFKQVRRFNEK